MINCALIGNGDWFDEAARKSLELNAIRMKYICDPEEADATALSERYPFVETTSNLAEILKDYEVEAVIVASAAGLRHEAVSECLAAGKHCLAAEPLAPDVSAAEKLMELAEKKSLILMCGQTACYSGPARLLKTMIQRNEVSTVEFYEARRLTLPPRRRSMHVIWELACEEFALMRFLLDREPLYVNAVSADPQSDRRQDIAFLTFHFENDLIAHLHLNRASMVQVSSLTIGTRHETILVDRLKHDGEISVCKLSSSRNLAGSRNSYDRAAMRAGDAYLPRIEAADAMVLMLAEFADCVKRNRKPATDAQAGVQTVRAISAAMRSISGNGISIPLWPPSWS